MIEVTRAPAFALVQDGGRSARRSEGVPPGGALDPFSLRLGNVLLGNDPGAAAVEWALTGGSLRFRSDAHVALTGAQVRARLNGARVPGGQVLAAGAGSELEVERLERGRLTYVCVAGGIDVPEVLGGRGSYLPAGFGGHGGRLLRRGDMLPIGVPSGLARAGARLPPEARGVLPLGAALIPSIDVLPGPESGVLPQLEWDRLLGRKLTVDALSDRMGFRLSGADLDVRHYPDRRSEPACVGAVQLTPDGTLIVLMQDGPTVGGYPRIAVVATVALPLLAQRRPNERVALKLVRPAEALAALREQRALLRRVAGRTGRLAG